MLDTGCWFLDACWSAVEMPIYRGYWTSIDITFSIWYPASSKSQVYSLFKGLTHLSSFWPNKTVNAVPG